MGLPEILSASKSGSTASDHLFPEIDVNKMVRRLKLVEHAQKRGPDKAGGDDFDAVEQIIVNEMESEKKIRYDDYLERQKTYVHRAGDARIQGLVSELHDCAAAASADFLRETHNGTDELYPLKREIIQTERELKRYRDDHRIKRPPYNYDKRSLKVGALIIILAVESVLNGFFLAKGSVFGLAGGVFEALMIAAVNIALGYIVGRLVVPWIGYKNRLAGFLGILGLLAYVVIAFGFNLAVAHYRNAIIGDPFDAPLAAYRSLVDGPLEIADLQSWMLFLIGVIFSVFAAIDGWLMDDPYPGYGRNMRHNLETLKTYNIRKDELLDDLEKIKNKAENDMKGIREKIQDRHRELHTIPSLMETLKAAMRQHFSHLESVGNTLLKIYRDECARHYPEAPRQVSNGKWTIEIPSIDEDTPTIGKFDHVDRMVEQSLRDIPVSRERLHEQYENSLNEYKKIDNLVDADVPL